MDLTILSRQNALLYCSISASTMGSNGNLSWISQPHLFVQNHWPSCAVLTSLVTDQVSRAFSALCVTTYWFPSQVVCGDTSSCLPVWLIRKHCSCIFYVPSLLLAQTLTYIAATWLLCIRVLVLYPWNRALSILVYGSLIATHISTIAVEVFMLFGLETPKWYEMRQTG